MLDTNLKNMTRKMGKEKFYTFINIGGLAFAITCILILSLYLRIELTYDQHHEKHEQVFRAVNSFNINGQESSFALSAQSLGPLLVHDFDQIVDYVRFRRNGQQMVLKHEDTAFSWPQVFITDDNVFDVFTHEVIYGDPDTALDDPSGIAVSETFARAYFGNENPLGKLVSNEDGNPYTINLVFADFPENTHLKYDVLFTYNNPQFRTPDDNDIKALEDSIYSVGVYTYVISTEDFEVSAFEEMEKRFIEQHIVETDTFTARFWLEPLDEIHYFSDLPRDEPKGNAAYLYGIMGVAAFILLVVCINYTNLATARSSRYSKEVGIRKILGASRSTLMSRYLLEAVFFVSVATVVAIVLVKILLSMNFASDLLGKTIEFHPFNEPQLLLWSALFALIVGGMAGLYPAFYLSSWAPMSALVSTSKNGAASNTWLRQILVFIQFAVSIMIIAGTLLMFGQMKFINSKELGFDKFNIISVRVRGADLIEQDAVLKNELQKNPNIIGATMNAHLPGQTWGFSSAQIENQDGTAQQGTFTMTTVDSDYLSVMNIDLLKGRNFSETNSIENSVIVNEAMVREMGWDEPIGKQFSEMRNFSGSVIGVVRDFHFASLHNLIEPLVIRPFNDDFENLDPRFRPYVARNMTIRISGNDVSGTLAYIKSVFDDFDPSHPFEYEFIDSKLDDVYESDTNLSSLIGIFAGVCIAISCLGLLGLSSYTTEQRKKEIAIRKILGASALKVIALLNKSVLWLILVGAAFGSLGAYLIINRWLTSFAYRIDIGLTPFVISTMLCLLVAHLTITLQSYKAAEAEPVDTIRYE